MGQPEKVWSNSKKLVIVQKGVFVFPGHKRKKIKGIYVILGIILVSGISGYLIFQSRQEVEPIIVEENGDYDLAHYRKKKLEEELEEIDHAIQYALLVSIPGYYDCYSCPDGQNKLYLQKGEVWKYGITRKGMKGRYPGKNLSQVNLIFVEQFIGPVGDCLKEEKRKIYNYPLLPEAINRDQLLIRPPGNKNDN